MPTYLYFCKTHNEEFEAVHSINETLIYCPKCKENGITSEPLKKLISPSSFILKGGGWASDNYSKK